MSVRVKPHYTLKEYFELELASEERYEYFKGEVFCMSGVSPNHAQIESNLITTLNNGLRERGCRVFPANIRIKVPAAPPYRYPDLAVVCDKPIYEEIGGIQALINPALLIEVLSPSTEAYDRGDKFTFYKSIPSFREYLLVAQHRPHITHYIKQAVDRWDYEETNDLTSNLQLPSVGCTLALSEVYLGVEFSQELQ
ncbi:MAG TPA: Uma2 family endonuclease [Pyrinomonadaceae bacterium]